VWVATGAGVVVLVLVAGWLATRGSSGDDEPAAVRTPARTTAPSTTVTTAPSVTTTAPAPVATTAPAAPDPAGPPYAVGVGHVTLEDADRGTVARGPTPASASRTLPVTVRYPASGAAGTEADAAVAASGRFPLVVFAHGYDISAADYAAFLRDLAAEGFVVVAPDFPRSSTVFPGPPTQADIDEQARDVGFLVEHFGAGSEGGGATGPWQGHVANGEAGVVGHSDGGNTVARAASNSCCIQTRIGAAAVLSGDEGTSGGQWGVAGSPPMLFVQGTADSINPWSLSQALYDDAASPKTIVAIDGADHLTPYTSGGQRGAVVALVAAFLRARLVDPAALGQVADRANRDGLRLVASS
jgi:dienelactone hydrolase